MSLQIFTFNTLLAKSRPTCFIHVKFGGYLQTFSIPREKDFEKIH